MRDSGHEDMYKHALTPTLSRLRTPKGIKEREPYGEKLTGAA